MPKRVGIANIPLQANAGGTNNTATTARNSIPLLAILPKCKSSYLISKLTTNKTNKNKEDQIPVHVMKHSHGFI
jgi:hypothetical protein